MSILNHLSVLKYHLPLLGWSADMLRAKKYNCYIKFSTDHCQVVNESKDYAYIRLTGEFDLKSS